jgi:hypothetical protein
LYAAACHDLDRRAGVVKRHKIGVRHHRYVDLSGADERDLIRKRWGIDEFKRDAVVLGQLPRVVMKKATLQKPLP